MKKVQNLSKYVKTHKLVSLGVVASAAALVATGIGTFSYFSDSKTANTNITLNKGTVKLGEFSKNKWQYIENTTNKNASEDADISSLKLPDRTYAGKTINPDLTAYSDSNTGGMTLEKFTSSDQQSTSDSSATSAALEGDKFANIVPGDAFRKTYEVVYTGSNAAEITMKLKWGDASSSKGNTWSQFTNLYDYIVKYSIDDNDTKTPDAVYTLISNTSTTGQATYSSLTSESGYKLKASTDENAKPLLIKKENKLHLYITVRMKVADYDAKDQADSNIPATIQSLGVDGFEVTVKNHLETKPVSTTTASN